MKWFSAFVGLLAALPAGAQETPPAVFTHAHNNSVQMLAVGTPVQVQLPAGPTDWTVETITLNAELVEQTLFASPGRVPGSVAVQVFEFDLPDPGRSVIVIRPDRHAKRGHRHRHHEGIHGRAFDSTFTLTLETLLEE